MFKTSAWPLALMYAALIVFASLFPFEGWRAQGIEPLVFLLAPLPPPYWTGFDVSINVAGYAPFGFLLALALLRSGVARGVVLAATLVGLLLSLGMEFLQIYLPRRVPSNLDFLLNVAGSFLGALVAALLERLGAINRWSDLRDRWFAPDSSGAMVLLALWPLALLFPAAVPFGLGQVLERAELAAVDILADTPFLDWLPLRDMDYDPLSPGGQLLCVTLGLLLPCWLAFSVVREPLRRVLLASALVSVGVGATALSAALSWGPGHAWEWMDLPTRAGLAGGVLVAALTLWLPRRVSAALLLLALAWHLAMLNEAPTSAYFAQTLQIWEQGRFIRFYGLGQWLGWLWPYAALLYVLFLIARRDAQT